MPSVPELFSWCIGKFRCREHKRYEMDVKVRNEHLAFPENRVRREKVNVFLASFLLLRYGCVFAFVIKLFVKVVLYIPKNNAQDKKY